MRAHPPTDIVSPPEMTDMQNVLKGETPVAETEAVAEAPPGEEDDPDSKAQAPVELSVGFVFYIWWKFTIFIKI